MNQFLIYFLKRCCKSFSMDIKVLYTKLDLKIINDNFFLLKVALIDFLNGCFNTYFLVKWTLICGMMIKISEPELSGRGSNRFLKLPTN